MSRYVNSQSTIRSCRRIAVLGGSLVWLVIVQLGLSVAFGQGPTTTPITVGVISPLSNSRSDIAGNAHQTAIQLALDRLGPIQVGDHEYVIVPEPADDQSDSGEAVRSALSLVTDWNVAAILGPVNSSSTRAVLEALAANDIILPVISSLSTAPELTAPRDPNFFRIIFDDQDRMTTLATFIDRNKRQPDGRYLFLYEDDPYGNGLNESLYGQFHNPQSVVSHTWSEVLDAQCDAMIFKTTEQADRNCNLRRLGDGELFNTELRSLFSSGDRPGNIIILGTTPGTLALTRGLETLSTGLRYYLVGNNKEIFENAPLGSIIIGNPVLDTQYARSADLRSEWDSILSQFEARSNRDRSDFVSTAYEAGMALHAALKIVLSDKTELPEIETLREELRDVLNENTFDALEPWRKIRFSGGDLVQPPAAPIYRVTRRPSRLENGNDQTTQWVQIDLPTRSNYLEGPINVLLSGPSGSQLTVDLIRNEGGIRLSQNVSLLTGQATASFHVFRPGTYRVELEGGIPQAPIRAETQVAFSNAYLLSALAALIGALLAVAKDSSSVRAKFSRVSLGIFTGLILTFGALYGPQIAASFPFPSLGEDPVFNALGIGFFSGLLGPHALVDGLKNGAHRVSMAANRAHSALDALRTRIPK